MSEQSEYVVQAQPEDVTHVANTADQPTSPEPVTIKGVAEAYLAHLAASGTKAGTVAVYGKVLDLALAHFGNERRIDSISLPQVGKFYASDTLNKFTDGRPKAEPTVKQARRVFRQCLEYALVQGWITFLPVPKGEMEHARSRKSQPEAVFPEPAEASQTDASVFAEINEPERASQE